MTPLTAAQCQELSTEYKLRSKVGGITAKRVTLSVNISRSYTALAHQLSMLEEDQRKE